VGRSRSGIHVTTPNRNLHGQKGIVLHRARALRPEHRTTIDGIPVTTVPRLLADLAGTLDKTGLKRVWQEAQRRKLLDVEAVKPLASQPRRGIGNLNALIDEAEDAPDTKTEFEHRFHDFIVERGIPRPVYNAAVGPYVVDALWPDAKLVVELDSRRSAGPKARSAGGAAAALQGRRPALQARSAAPRRRSRPTPLLKTARSQTRAARADGA
jgi:hypothetical protein